MNATGSAWERYRIVLSDQGLQRDQGISLRTKLTKSENLEVERSGRTWDISVIRLFRRRRLPWGLSSAPSSQLHTMVRPALCPHKGFLLTRHPSPGSHLSIQGKASRRKGNYRSALEPVVLAANTTAHQTMLPLTGRQGRRQGWIFHRHLVQAWLIYQHSPHERLRRWKPGGPYYG
jgi:hypothetical protein